MLRVKMKIVFTLPFSYVEFCCSTCKKRGGLAATYIEALKFWNDQFDMESYDGVF